MGTLFYLLSALAVMIIVYVLYRHTFLKRPKPKHPFRPHFTLKIESDQT